MVFQPGELTVFFFSSRRRHTRCSRDWSSDVCSSDLLSKIVTKRPGPGGTLVPCETWDNALLACEVQAGGQHFPMLFETKRMAPGETNTWYLRVLGTAFSAEFSTKYPKTLRTLAYTLGSAQA